MKELDEIYDIALCNSDNTLSRLEKLQSDYQEVRRYISNLQNNWNELKKWLEEEITKLRDFPLQDVERVAKRISLERTLKKLNKLEEELERGEE